MGRLRSERPWGTRNSLQQSSLNVNPGPLPRAGLGRWSSRPPGQRSGGESGRRTQIEGCPFSLGRWRGGGSQNRSDTELRPRSSGRRVAGGQHGQSTRSM